MFNATFCTALLLLDSRVELLLQVPMVMIQTYTHTTASELNNYKPHCNQLPSLMFDQISLSHFQRLYIIQSCATSVPPLHRLSAMSTNGITKRPAEDVADSSEEETRPPRKKHLRKRTCLVCDVEKGINQFPSSKRVSFHDHGSNICRPCFIRHVEVEIDSKNWDQVACPECPTILEYNEVKKMTSAEKFEK